MRAVLTRGNPLACDAWVTHVLLLAVGSLALASCGGAHVVADAEGGSPKDAAAPGKSNASEAGTFDAGRSEAATSDATTETSSDAASSDAAGADAAASDAVAFGAPPVDGGSGSTLCRAMCGPGQMNCPSPLGSATCGLEGQIGLNYCFPLSEAGCAGMYNSARDAGGCNIPMGVSDGGVCGPGLTNCSGACVDTTSNPFFCGSCTNSCAPAASGSATCVDSTCVAACVPGWTACGNTCSVTTADAANCGACGHACAAGEICTASACVAQSSVWLATGLTSPSQIAVDQNNVYWSDATLNSVSAVSKTGGSTIAIATPQSMPLTGLQLDGTYIYYWQGATIQRARKDGTGSPQLIATVATQGLALGVDSTSVYFVGLPAGDPPTVQSVPKAGGTPTLFVTTIVPGVLSAAVSDDLAMYVKINNGGPRTPYQLVSYDFPGLVAGPDVSGAGLENGPLSVDAINVYSNDLYGIAAFEKHSGVPGEARGIFSEVYVGAACGILWADSSGIHWTAIDSVLAGQGALTQIATQVIAPGVGPVAALIADGNNVYWTDTGAGAIGKLWLP